MKYTIITLNDERKAYKDVIRSTLHFDEIVMPAVDGHAVDVWGELSKRGIYKNVWFSAKLGELGVWMSNFDRWELASTMDEPLIVFEDDATPDSSFDSKISEFIKELPADWDFAALWVPEEQRRATGLMSFTNEESRHAVGCCVVDDLCFVSKARRPRRACIRATAWSP